MSYTLRGRLESRLALLLPVVAAACVLAVAEHRWWPVEAVALMLGVGLALDLQVYHRLLPYQPGWAAVPLGLVELGLVLGLMRAAGVIAPLGQAVGLFAGGWLVAQLLSHTGFPLLRLGYAEEGGELGRFGVVSAVLVGVTLAAAAGTAYALQPPVVQLARGVHQGPLVITRREVLVGAPGAIVRGGIVVRANGVTIRNVSVVGGENGIAVDGYRDTVLDGVSVSGAKLDGIHVRLGGVMIKNCNIDMLGNSLGQGIDISYNMNMGMSMVEGCNVVGGMDGIVTHSSMTEIARNHVSRTKSMGISMTEMSMGMIQSNEVRGALGVGINCGDRSMCEIHKNVVIGTRSDAAGGNKTRAGFGVEVLFGAEAELFGNDLANNAAPVGVFQNSTVRWKR
ncbi:MAG TPA: right-handed parallel beta-helix repeat-containing protein [Gaiellaceae bacterium]|nr:right-handed parallel beta-helix repeat-containing protein [Gaiellaceae bacterium]